MLGSLSKLKLNNLYIKKDMFKLVSLGFLIWAFFNPFYASISFIALIILLEGWFFLLDITKNPNLKLIKEKYNLNDGEVIIYKKYYVFYTVPTVSAKTSEVITGFQFSAIIWVPLLLYNGLWIPAIIIGLNIFLANYLSRKLKPLHFAYFAKQRERIFYEKADIKAVYNKIVTLKNNHKESDLSLKELEKKYKDPLNYKPTEEDVARVVRNEWESLKVKIKDILNELKEPELELHKSKYEIEKLRDELDQAEQELSMFELFNNYRLRR